MLENLTATVIISNNNCYGTSKMRYIDRLLQQNIQKSLLDMPALFITGPRQVGKSTLVKHLTSHMDDVSYITFDDVTALSAATSDPSSFLRGLKRLVVIDEVQLAPSIFRTIKMLIDQYRLEDKKQSNGRFLLTGSANILALPTLSEALVGRMGVTTLYPFSALEVVGKQASIVDKLFAKHLEFKTISKYSVSEVMQMSSFPELKSQHDSNLWFSNYLATLLQRDIRSLAQIEKITELPNMLKILAARVGGLLNDADCARDAGLNQMTYRRYRTLFQHLFLITLLPPWFKSIKKRLMKAPKIYFTDTNLLCYILGVDLPTLRQRNPTLFGYVLENFVASELMKQIALDADYALYHFHTLDSKEVDFIIAHRNGKVVGVEVKSAESVTSQDFNGLRVLKECVGQNFVRGVVLYQGKQAISFGKDLIAMPIEALWST